MMNIFSAVRERINAVVGAAIGAVLLLACGALMAFVLSPRQAIQARRVENMPEMDAAAVAAAHSGADVLISGRLQDNEVVEAAGFVAYKVEEWAVTPANADDSNDDPHGTWKAAAYVVPDLVMDVGGQTVRILRAGNVSLSGPLHEEVRRSSGFEEAKYEGQWLPDGSRRLRGFFDGDLMTALGKKASTGGVIPQELYAGDRVAFVESKHKSARGLFIGGLCTMGLAPVVLVVVILGGVFGRRRRWR